MKNNIERPELNQESDIIDNVEQIIKSNMIDNNVINEFTWYKIVEENWWLSIYKLKKRIWWWYETDKKTRKHILWEKLDPQSKEYKSTLDYMKFLATYQFFWQTLGSGSPDLFWVLDQKWLNSIIQSWAFRIKDSYILSKQWYINDDLFNKNLPILKDKLWLQIFDDRFDKIEDPVTVEEIEFYLWKEYITRQTWEEYIQAIKERDENLRQKEMEIKKEIEKKQKELKSLKKPINKSKK